MVKAQVRKTVPVGQLHIVPAVMTQRFPDMIRVHALVCGKSLDNFLVIIVPAKLIGEPLPELAPAAAELPADGDDAHRTACFHLFNMLRFLCLEQCNKISPTPGFVNSFPWKTDRRRSAVRDRICGFGFTGVNRWHSFLGRSASHDIVRCRHRRRCHPAVSNGRRKPRRR